MKELKQDALCTMVYRVVQLCLLLLALVLMVCFGVWKSLPLFFWLVWNNIFYDIGCQDNCVDEWEDGYPRDGLSYMLKSWRFLLFIIGAYYYFLFR